MNETKPTTMNGQTGAPVKSPEIKIETDKLFTIKTPDGDISPTGQNELKFYLSVQGLNQLPDDFEYIWTTRRGTLPKRIQSHLYKAHGVKVTPEQVSNIGNIAKRHADTGKTFVMDFTNRIDWQDGDFGDSGSCYWGDKCGAKEMIEEHAFAIRAYKPSPYSTVPSYGNVTGYARAWVAPIGENMLVVFNGYGETTLTFARLLSLKFNCGYQRISLTNNGDYSGVLWINNSTGFVIGDWSVIHKITEHDFGWPDIEPKYECHACGGHISEFIWAYNNVRDEYRYCEECCFSCDMCGACWDNDCSTERNGMSYCLNCARVHDRRTASEAARNAEVAL